jgi:hypothetical protein
MKEAVLKMSDTPTGEFWKDLRPIENAFRPDALPEVYLSQRCELPGRTQEGRAA